MKQIPETLHSFRGSGTEADQKPHKATQEAAFMYERRDRLPAAHTEKRRETRNADRLINIYLAEKTRLNKAI